MPKVTWFWQSMISMLLLVPAWLGLAGFSRAWNVRGEVALFWYMLGVIIGVGAFTLKTSNLFPENSHALWWILGLGVFVGSAANIFSYRALAEAPNAGLSIAITGSASIFVFLATILLSYFFPKFFVPQAFDWIRFAGVLLAVAGIALVSVRQ